VSAAPWIILQQCNINSWVQLSLLLWALQRSSNSSKIQQFLLLLAL
jgi:hypothetical protein